MDSMCYIPPNFLFLPWWQTSNCHSPLIPNKPFFAWEISTGLSVPDKQVQLSSYSFMDWAFGVISLESLPKLRSQDFSLMFSSRSFIVLSCTLKSMIPFYTQCVVRIKVYFLKIWISNCYSTIYKKTIISSLNAFPSSLKISYPNFCIANEAISKTKRQPSEWDLSN